MDTTNTWLAEGDHETQSLTEVSIPDWAKTALVRVARWTTPTPQFWPDTATQITLQLEYDNDGNGWVLGDGIGGEGGLAFGRHGGESQYTSMLIELASGEGRKMRGDLTVTNGPLHSILDVVFSDT